MGDRADERVTERAHQLYKQAIAKKERMDALRERHYKGLTFSPSVNRVPGSRRSSLPTASSAKRFETLYEDAKARQRRAKEKESTPDPAMTFKPSISKKSRGTTRKGNVFDNLYGKAVSQHEKMKAKEERAGLDADCTFTPKTNRKRGDKPIKVVTAPSSRLYDGDKVKERQEKLAVRRKEEELKECTFTPRTTPKSSKLRGEVGRRVFERLYEDQKKLASKRSAQKAQREKAEVEGCTFKPKFQVSKKVARNLLLSRDAAAVGSAHERLYSSGVERLKARRDEPDPKELGYTFTPEFMSSSATAPMRMDRGVPRFQELYENGVREQKERTMEVRNTAHKKEEEDATKEESEEAKARAKRIAAAAKTGDVWERLYQNRSSRSLHHAAEAATPPAPPAHAARVVEDEAHSRIYIQ